MPIQEAESTARRRFAASVQASAAKRGRKAAAGGALVMLLLLVAGCERWRGGDPAPGSAGGTPRPFPERFALGEVIAETRGILPRVPASVEPPPLGPPPPSEAATAESAVRLALMGEGPLLRPNAFPGLPPHLRVAVHLDERRPPGGFLSVTPARSDAGGDHRWSILDSHLTGNPDEAFALTLRAADPAGQLRYLVVLGIPYEVEGARYRALEGYLLHPGGRIVPGTAGRGSGRADAVYPLDFGYRHPHPPRPVQAAAAWAQMVTGLRGAYEAWLSRRNEWAQIQKSAQALRELEVPPDKVEQKQRDLASFAARAEALRVELASDAESLRARLKAAYRERAALAAAWRTFTESNAFRWRDAAGRRAAYAPLEALRPLYPALEQIFAGVAPDNEAEAAALGEARTAMEQALLAEREPVP